MFFFHCWFGIQPVIIDDVGSEMAQVRGAHNKFFFFLFFFPIVCECFTTWVGSTPGLISSGLDRNCIFLPAEFPQSLPPFALVLQILKQTLSFFCSLIIFRNTHAHTLPLFILLHICPPTAKSTCPCLFFGPQKGPCTSVCVCVAQAAEDVGVYTDAQSDN